MTVKFLDLAAQYQAIKPQIDEAIAEVLNEASFIGGRRVSAFEAAFAAYQGAQHCVSVGNATDGLEIAIEALQLPPHSEVIVPANSFVASSEAVTRAGHRVVFADVTDNRYTIRADDVERHITPRTAALVVVHLYGQSADMDALMSLARKHNLKVVEDAAQAVGAEFNGRRVGAIGDIGVFSFYPGKNLGAYGDAGAITTNSAEIATRARMISNHGRVSKYDHEFEGRNSRLDALQASILSVKLNHIEEWTRRRQEVARLYADHLSSLAEVILPEVDPRCRHVYHLYVIRTDHRDALAAHLKSEGIETGVHYPIALPALKAYAHLGQQGNAPHAVTNAKKLLSLPMGEHLRRTDIEAVAGAIRSFFA